MVSRILHAPFSVFRPLTFQTSLKCPFSGYSDKKVVIRFPVGRMATRIRAPGAETLQRKKVKKNFFFDLHKLFSLELREAGNGSDWRLQLTGRYFKKKNKKKIFFVDPFFEPASLRISLFSRYISDIRSG